MMDTNDNSTITSISLRTTLRTAKHVQYMYECPYVCCPYNSPISFSP